MNSAGPADAGIAAAYGEYYQRVINVKVVLTTLNAKYIHSSLALRSLAASCRQDGLDITVKEYTINNELLTILGDLWREKPSVVGLACYIWNTDLTLALVRLLKKVLPATTVVLGGPEVSYDSRQLMADNPEVDYIILGEGEETLAALLAALAVGKPVTGIAGLAWRNGGIHASQPRVVASLDSLPFAYRDADMAELKDKIIYYETSRGCPFACRYCLSGATTGVRFLSGERVRRELAFFIAHGVKQVKFVDRTFNAKKAHYLPILHFLASRDTATNFHFEIAADLLDEAVLAFLRTVPPGRFQFEIGVQSTNPATLDAIERKNDWPRIVAGVGGLRAGGNSHLHLDLIAGLPYEDYRRFGESFNDVYRLRPDMLQLGFLKLLKGSGIRRQAADHGYIFADAAPYEVLANNYLAYADIRRLKIIEEVLNQTYNSGRFTATLAWLVAAWQDDAFAFYEALAVYWEEGDLHMTAHSGKGLARILADFCRTVKPELAATVREFLKFDALLTDRGAVRPAFLPWDGEAWQAAKTAFWREEAIVRKYLPDYTFTSWRDVKNSFHLEIFACDIPEWLATGHMSQRPTVVLFAHHDPGRRYQKVTAGDFPLEDR